MSSPPPTLLTLPLELRIQIYNLLIPPLTSDPDDPHIYKLTSRFDHFLPLIKINHQIRNEMRSLYSARHYVYVNIFNGRVRCFLPPGFTGRNVADWQRVRGKEEYPDLLKECKNVLLMVDHFHIGFFGKGVETLGPLLKQFLPTLERAESVKIYFMKWERSSPKLTCFEAKFLDMVREGLNTMPRLRQYCIMDKFSSLMYSWRWVGAQEKIEEYDHQAIHP